MLEINIEKCTGCGACVQRCPKKCISWEKREFGFRYPKIDKENCISCGLCEKVCPIEKTVNKCDEQKVYAVVHKDVDILKRSTSGGAFSALAHYIFEKQGVVYGCKMDEKLQVMHVRVDKADELGQLRGSKYVQSDVGNTYQLVEEDLKNELWVLYTGTPCQIAGLKHFLGREYEKLITVDIICHGVGSQDYFNKYLDYAREKYGEIKELRFRSKEFVGWSCGGGAIETQKASHRKIRPFKNYNNYYYYYFLKGDIYRESCYQCKYANTIRVGDFTLGDFWGVEAYDLSMDTINGCSLVLVNSKKAMEIFEVMGDISKLEVDLEQALRRNEQLRKPSGESMIRGKLVRQFEALDAKQIQLKFILDNGLSIVKGFIKSMMPYKLRVIIRKML